MIPELIGLAAATMALAFMYVRAPQSATPDDDITQEIPVAKAPVERSVPAPAQPYLPRSGPAWHALSGEFVITGEARRAGDLALVEVPLAKALRRPPIASRICDDSPAPGSVSLIVRNEENCVESTLRVATSGKPRSSATTLVVCVNARDRGPFRLHGRFKLRG